MSLIEYQSVLLPAIPDTDPTSRRFDSADQVRYVVADKVQAEYVTRMCDLCPDKRYCRCRCQPALKAALDDVANKGRGRKATKTDEEMREAHRQHEAKRRAAKAAAEGRKPGRAGRPEESLNVTGAKPRAWVEILLAPTRCGSIQAACDRPG